MDTGKNYKFGSKNNWRRWEWNRIDELLPVPRKEATVLYLPGEQDLDRVEAVRRGFSDNLLFAVDRDGQVIDSLRDRQVSALRGNIIDVLYAWKGTIDVVVADFMGGLSDRTLDFIVALQESESIEPHHTVIAVNMMRGRDASGAIAMDLLRENNETGRRLGLPHTEGDKHRGRALYGLISGWWAGYADKVCGPVVLYSVGNKHIPIVKHRETIMHPVFHDFRLRSPGNPLHASYKSGRLSMDSLVFRWPGLPPGIDPLNWPQLRVRKMKRQIAAVRAVRTMRSNGNRARA